MFKVSLLAWAGILSCDRSMMVFIYVGFTLTSISIQVNIQLFVGI